MASPEACCERVGSTIHRIYDPARAKGSPGAMMDIVYLLEGKVTCLGSARDEAICKEVSTALFQKGLRPLRTTRPRGHADGHEPHKSLGAILQRDIQMQQQSGFWAGQLDTESSDGGTDNDVGGDMAMSQSRWQPDADIAEAVRSRRSKHMPPMSLESVDQALPSAVMGESLAAAPIFYQRPESERKAKKGKGQSPKDALQEWLRGEEGSAWVRTKRARVEPAKK